MKVTLEFDAENERQEARAAFNALELMGTLEAIRERARSALKHDSDTAAALNEIRQLAHETLWRVE